MRRGKIKWGVVLGITLQVFCILALFILILSLVTTREKQRETIATLTMENLALRATIKDKNEAYATLGYEKNQEIKEIRETLGLLVTFKDAGLPVRSNEDIRQLVELSKQVPYGSPFKSGHRYTSMYGPRDEQTYGGSPFGHHQGVDIVPLKWADQTVNATADGVIIDFGYSDTLGKYIVFETAGGFRLKYAHLKTIYYQNDDGLVKGVPIQRGQRLGIMGSTGSWSTGPHLHLEIHVLNPETGEYTELNPWRIIEFIGGEPYEKL